MRQCARAKAPPGRPTRITLGGGKGGVGTTTLAVNLAVALAARHGRTLLVDADPDRADAAVFCGIEPCGTVADVLAGQSSVEEALQDGPGGIQILPGSLASSLDTRTIIHRQLIEPLGALGNRFEFVVVDGGNGSGPRTRQMWHAADLVLLVTTPELPSVMDAYASVKLLADSAFRGRIHTLVNMAIDAATACEVHGRLARACQRFLGVRLESAGHVPGEPAMSAAADAGTPIVMVGESVPAAQHIARLARTLAATAAVAHALAPAAAEPATA